MSGTEAAGASGGRFRLEAHAVVLDLEQQSTVITAEPDGNAAGARMLDRILDRFLGDAEDVAVSGGVDRQLAVQDEVDLVPFDPAQQLHVLAERSAEPVPPQVGRP